MALPHLARLKSGNLGYTQTEEFTTVSQTLTPTLGYVRGCVLTALDPDSTGVTLSRGTVPGQMGCRGNERQINNYLNYSRAIHLQFTYQTIQA